MTLAGRVYKYLYPARPEKSEKGGSPLAKAATGGEYPANPEREIRSGVPDSTHRLRERIGRWESILQDLSVSAACQPMSEGDVHSAGLPKPAPGLPDSFAIGGYPGISLSDQIRKVKVGDESLGTGPVPHNDPRLDYTVRGCT